MLEQLRKISEIPCVNGGERSFSSFLENYFKQKSFAVQRLPGNHILVRKSDLKPNTVLFTPMDSPGFVCLYREDGIAYLSPTSKALDDIKDFDSVINNEGVFFKLEETKYDKSTFCVKNDQIRLGESLSVSSTVSVVDSVITGRFASKYACVAMLMKLAELITNPDVAICFTAGFHSGAKAESNVLKRIGANNAILLNFADVGDSLQMPILAIKDGKHFSSDVLSNAFSESCSENGFPLRKIVFDKAISAAERIYAPHVREVLSLALPCSNLYSDREKVFAIDAMLQALTHFFNTNKF